MRIAKFALVGMSCFRVRSMPWGIKTLLTSEHPLAIAFPSQLCYVMSTFHLLMSVLSSPTAYLYDSLFSLHRNFTMTSKVIKVIDDYSNRTSDLPEDNSIMCRNYKSLNSKCAFKAYIIGIWPHGNPILLRSFAWPWVSRLSMSLGMGYGSINDHRGIFFYFFCFFGWFI